MEAQYPYGRFAGLSTAPAEEIPADNGVMTTNEKLAALTQEKESLEKELTEVEAEIEYQIKLRDLEVSGDPLWEMAKDKYIHTGEMSDLSNILQRKTTASEAEKQRQFTAAENKLNRDANYKLAKEAKEQTKAEQKEANVRSARFSRNVLSELLKTYNAVKGDTNKQIEAGNELIKQLQDVKEKAEIAGLNMEDLYSEMPEELEAVNLAIDEARVAAQTSIARDKAKVAAAAAAQRLRNMVANEVNAFNETGHDALTARDKKKELENNSRFKGKFTFSVVKSNKKGGGYGISYTEKK